MEVTPQITAGTGFIYSDINFIALGSLVEHLSGQTLADYALQHILVPLGGIHFCFTPSREMRHVIAPTQYDENGMMLRGVVHDPTARRMGRVSGNAGLFSDADDITLYAQTLLN
ncbi:serine hydrolase [Acetobacter fallax]|uniref:serine hydrolase n=1 Tax=Acetobacter fallax TaxID=1737473 RepID=UPI001F5548CB|nr:serine hydrolase [Acetobacter fallax]